MTLQDAIDICAPVNRRLIALGTLERALADVSPTLRAQLALVVEAARPEPTPDAIRRLTLTARNLNVLFIAADAGDHFALERMKRDGISAVDIAIAADACTYCAIELEAL